MDERHGWEALRYVELNPVRAGLVERAEDWRWSSAGAHATGTDDAGLLDLSAWTVRWTPASWRETLELGLEDAALVQRIREATRTGRPAAADAGLRHLERDAGRRLRPQKRGPKGRPFAGPAQLEFGGFVACP